MTSSATNFDRGGFSTVVRDRSEEASLKREIRGGAAVFFISLHNSSAFSNHRRMSLMPSTTTLRARSEQVEVQKFFRGMLKRRGLLWCLGLFLHLCTSRRTVAADGVLTGKTRGRQEVDKQQGKLLATRLARVFSAKKKQISEALLTSRNGRDPASAFLEGGEAAGRSAVTAEQGQPQPSRTSSPTPSGGTSSATTFVSAGETAGDGTMNGQHLHQRQREQQTLVHHAAPGAPPSTYPGDHGDPPTSRSAVVWQRKVQELEDLVRRLGNKLDLQEETTREQSETILKLRNGLDAQQVSQNVTAARIASAGAVAEIIQQYHIAYLFSILRKDFVLSAALLVIGYVVVLVGLSLPTKLLFFPPAIYLPQETDEQDQQDRGVDLERRMGGRGDEITGEERLVQVHSEQRGEDAPPADGLRLRKVEQHGEDQERPLRQKCILLPYDFAAQGTLSSVCQFQDSTEGKVWTTCLVTHTVCVLLSQYTITGNLYPVWCDSGGGMFTEYSMLNMSSMSSAEMLLRVVWLVFPCIGLLLTAAVPTAPADTEGSLRPALLRAFQQKGNRREDLEPQDAVEYYRARNMLWQIGIHSLCAPLSIAVLLIFETYQLTQTEGVSFAAAIFGVGEQDAVDEKQLQSWAIHQGTGNAFCGWEQSWRPQWAPTIFRFRAVFVLLSWIFCTAFLILCAYLHLIPPSERQARGPVRAGSASRPGGRSSLGFLPYEGGVSLVVPQLCYAMEVAGIVCVFLLPFFPIMYQLSFRFAPMPGSVPDDYVQVLSSSGSNIRLVYETFWDINSTSPKYASRGPGFANSYVGDQCSTSWGTHTWRDPLICGHVPGWNQTENGTSVYWWEWHDKHY
ncbi:unnamed protein product [Amoebophrya sp. A120]|nr:unnamed protein product [Amoebophrya sp. A120]|eukprot:GSA120T00015574001.1